MYEDNDLPFQSAGSSRYKYHTSKSSRMCRIGSNEIKFQLQIIQLMHLRVIK